MWAVNSCVICDGPCDPGAAGAQFIFLSEIRSAPLGGDSLAGAVVCLHVQMFVLIDLSEWRCFPMNKSGVGVARLIL